MGSKGIVATNIAAATAMLTTITMIAVNSVRGPFILEPSLLKGGLVRQVVPNCRSMRRMSISVTGESAR